ncbi:MAG: hypothetical protein ACLQBJ_20135 [Bryobacteraceae bacterium]
MLRLLCLLTFLIGAPRLAESQVSPGATVIGQSPRQNRPVETPSLPNDEQKNAMLKEAYSKNLEDLRKMQRLLWEVRTEVANGSPFVLPLHSIKKLEEIEKLSKTVRARMKVY